MSLFLTLSINDTRHKSEISIRTLSIGRRYAECHDYLRVMLSVVMLNVVMLGVVMLSFVAPKQFYLLR